jgi:hypothetical protein
LSPAVLPWLVPLARATPPPPVHGGQAASEDDYPMGLAMLVELEVVREVEGSYPTRWNNCSAARIAPDVVLTAAHCLEEAVWSDSNGGYPIQEPPGDEDTAAGEPPGACGCASTGVVPWHPWVLAAALGSARRRRGTLAVGGGMAMPGGRLALVASAVLLAGCHGAPDRVCAVEPDEETGLARGDANGDGALDVSDVVYVSRHALAGGPAPPCLDAAETVADGQVNPADGMDLWLHLVGSSDLEPLSGFSCLPPLTFPEAPGCARVGFDLDAPRRVEATGTASFEVVVGLESRDVEVHGWSLSVAVEGDCALASGTTSGTAAADGWLEGQGLRRMGMEYTGLTADGGSVGLISLVVLGWLDGEALPPGKKAHPVLRIDMEGSPPASGCSECRIFLQDGRQGAGPPVRNVISHQGFSYVPEPAEVTIPVCAG